MHTAVRWLMVMATMTLGTSAIATGARNSALNLDRWRMLDSTSIQLTPADMLSFKKIVYGELGTGTGAGDDYAAAFLPVGPGVLGIYAGAIPSIGGVNLLAMADDATLDSTVIAPGVGGVVSTNVVQNGLLGSNGVFGRVRVLYGLELANRMRLAGGVSYYSRTTQEDSFKSAQTLPLPENYGTSKYMDSSSAIGIHAGANLILGPISPLAIGVEVGLPSFDASYTHPDGTENSYKSDSGMDLNANVRARIPGTLGKDVETTGFASFGTGTLEADSASRLANGPTPNTFLTVKDGSKTIEQGHITVGASNSHRLGEGTVAFYSLSFENTTSGLTVVDTPTPSLNTTETTTTTNDLPFVLGLETRLARWIVFRFSSKSSLMTRTTTDYKYTLSGGLSQGSVTDQTIVDNNSSQTFAMGLTLDVSDRLSIEGVLSETLLFNGPYFVGGPAATITGTGTGGPGLFGRVSLIARIRPRPERFGAHRSPASRDAGDRPLVGTADRGRTDRVRVRSGAGCGGRAGGVRGCGQSRSRGRRPGRSGVAGCPGHGRGVTG